MASMDADTGLRARLRRGPRLLCLAGTMLITLATASPAAADTTAETGISVTTRDAGGFSIEFAALAGGYTFSGAGGGALTVSAIAGNSATATIQLAWTDTRVDGQRPPYTIALSASDLTPTGTVPTGAIATIPATNLTIIQIAANPANPPLSLDQPRTVFTSDANPPAGPATLDIILHHLDIPPSTYPTTYSTELHVQVSPGAGMP